MRLLNTFLDLLYPPRCAFCHRILSDSSEQVCRFCRDKLPYTAPQTERPAPDHVDRCFSPLYYEASVQDSLRRFKFSQRTGYAGIYAEYMVKCIDENDFSCDIISWAPVSRKRLRSRGYDQSELLAKAVAVRYDLPCRRTLDKIRHTAPQSLTNNARQRRENVKGAYRCIDPALVRGKRVLLIDDILTTGATLSECAKVLKESDAAEVYALTAACGRK